MQTVGPLEFRTSPWQHLPGYGSARSIVVGLQSVTRRYAMWRLRRAGLLDLLDGRPGEAFPIEADDLWFLYCQARKRKPHYILEYGSGFSTSIFAEAVRRNGHGKVVSVEALASWRDVTQKALARHGLDGFATVLHIPAVPTEMHGKPAWKHESLPPGKPDFIYFDGPKLDVERPFAVDPLMLEERDGPIPFLVIDGRKANWNYLKLHLKHPYRFRWRRLHYNGVMEHQGQAP